MKMSNKIYDVLKLLCTVVLPAVATLFAALCSAWEWNLPVGAILATISAVEVFIGALIGLSNAQYQADMKIKELDNKE